MNFKSIVYILMCYKLRFRKFTTKWWTKAKRFGQNYGPVPFHLIRQEFCNRICLHLNEIILISFIRPRKKQKEKKLWCCCFELHLCYPSVSDLNSSDHNLKSYVSFGLFAITILFYFHCIETFSDFSFISIKFFAFFILYTKKNNSSSHEIHPTHFA